MATLRVGSAGEDVERHAEAATAELAQAVEVDSLHPGPGPVASVEYDDLGALVVPVAGKHRDRGTVRIGVFASMTGEGSSRQMAWLMPSLR